MLPRLHISEETKQSTQNFLAKLHQSTFSGDIHQDYGTRLVTATDNSIYQVLPQAVIYPKNAEDIQTVLKLAAEERFRKNIKITPRGGGTGTNGQSLSEGLILDCSRYMNRILETNLKEAGGSGGWVRVEPGVVLDQLNDSLAPHKVFFAPNLSPSSRATLGGMVNTDACGKGSRVYGRTSDHVLELSCVLSNGEVLRSFPLAPEELAECKNKSGMSGNIFRVVDQIVTEKADLIEKVFPKMSRFMTGYNLAKVHDDSGNHEKKFNLNYLLSGSEGTLAVVTEAKLRLTPIPKHKCLLVVKYSVFDDALSAAETLVASNPTAIETIDEKILDLAKEDEIYLKVKDFIADEEDRPTRTVNLVEFSGNNKRKVAQQVSALCKVIEGNKALSGTANGYYRTTNPEKISDLWNLRKKGVGLLGNTKGERKPLPFVEDTAVPPENLAAYIREFRNLLESYGLEYAMFGHIDVGCLHVRPALNLKNPQEESWIRELSDQVAELVKKYGGVMWSEHGRGFRSEYTPEFFGVELHQDLRRVKTAFDPYNRLNPGKIVTPISDAPAADSEKVVSLEGPLRGYKDRQITPELRQEYEAAINCNGNGACFDYAAENVMCPSSRITRDRVHSPKGRAGLLREWLRQFSLNTQKHTQNTQKKETPISFFKKTQNTLRKKQGEDDFSHEVYQAMAGCLACKACATQCPVHVDIPELRAKFLALYHSRYLRPLKDYFVAATETVGRLFAQIPWPVNVFLNFPFNRNLLKNYFGLQDLPDYSLEPVRLRLRNCQAPEFDLELLNSRTPEESKRCVILLQDAFTSFYESQVVLDFYDFLNRLDYTVYVAPFHPNGKPLHIKGFLGAFRKVAGQNTKWLATVAQSGIPMIGIDPSVVLTYRDEYLKILDRNELPFEVLLPQEFLFAADFSQEHFGKFGTSHTKIHKNKTQNSAPDVPEKMREYQLLGHCMEKTGALLSQQQWQEVFKKFGLSLALIPAGCCGMAGTYGHETVHYKESQGIYDLSWRDKIPQERFLRQKILATGFSCRSQIRRFEGFRPLHPVQALLRELKL